MSGREQPRVALRSAFSRFLGIDNADLPAVALQIEARRDADYAGADYHRLSTTGILLAQGILLLVRVSMSVICPCVRYAARQVCWGTTLIL